MKKNRKIIPKEMAAEVLFLSDRTCCVCNIRGKQIQIHHIDENPSNNLFENLAVLCFECHNDTMIEGGFGRKLDDNQVTIYNNNWKRRVAERRNQADEIASIETVTGYKQDESLSFNFEQDYLEYKTHEHFDILLDYLQKILIVQKAQYTISKTKWDIGVNSIMNQGSYDMIDFYEEVLIELATFYPKYHFENKPPRQYFSEYTASRFSWHSLAMQPKGEGTRGTMLQNMAGASVMKDLKEMVLDLVYALSFQFYNEKKFDFLKWKKKWLKH